MRVSADMPAHALGTLLPTLPPSGIFRCASNSDALACVLSGQLLDCALPVPAVPDVAVVALAVNDLDHLESGGGLSPARPEQ